MMNGCGEVWERRGRDSAKNLGRKRNGYQRCIFGIGMYVCMYMKFRLSILNRV
jgi:hypothetical protein